VVPFKSHGDEDVVLAAWTLPLIVGAIAVTIVGGFYLGGPGLGLAVGVLAASTVVFLAARAEPRGTIVPAPLHDLRRHVLLVSRAPLEDPRAVEEIADLCVAADPWSAESEVRLLVPRSGRLLDRWSGERRGTVEAAQRRCVLSLAALSKAGLAARAEIGDEDVVLAVEDQLRTYPATDVILVTTGEEGAEAERVADELRERLQADFLHLEPVRGSAAAPAAERRGHRFTP